MPKYAEGTTVPIHRSRIEIEDLLKRCGCRNIFMAEYNNAATAIFEQSDQPYLMQIELPDQNDTEFATYRCGRGVARRTPAQRQDAWDRECKRRWRELALIVKAKVLIVESASSASNVDFKTEFLSFAMLPNRATVGDLAKEQLARFAFSGELPQMLPRRRQ